MKKSVSGILFAIAALLFTTALGLCVIQFTGFPYIVDIDYLKIPERAGITHDEVLQNYNAIMDFITPFSQKEFSLPTLTYTEQASKHFAECRTIFNAVYVLGGAAGLIIVILAATKSVSKNTLKISGAGTLAIPAIIGAALAIDFDKAFIFFHKIFFEGSSWIFEPETDSFILIMPSTFFMHCAIFIALFWVAGAAIQLIIAYSKAEVRKF